MLIGGDALHWADQAKFLELMLSRSMGDYERVGAIEGPVFFDRGIPELAGYCRLVKIPRSAARSAGSRAVPLFANGVCDAALEGNLSK